MHSCSSQTPIVRSHNVPKSLLDYVFPVSENIRCQNINIAAQRMFIYATSQTVLFMYNLFVYIYVKLLAVWRSDHGTLFQPN